MLRPGHIMHQADHIVHQADRIVRQVVHTVHHLVVVASVVVVSVVVAEDAVVNIFLAGNSAPNNEKTSKVSGQAFYFTGFFVAGVLNVNFHLS